MKELEYGQRFPQTDEEALEYLPDDSTSRHLYGVYRTGYGYDIATSMRKVLKAHVNEPEPIGKRDES